MKRIATGLAVLTAWVLVGCSPWVAGSDVPSGAPAPVRQINAIILPETPVPLDWDGKEGLDGLRPTVLLFALDKEQAVPAEGTLELHLFDGEVSAEQAENTRPFFTWVFEAEDLPAYLVRRVVGWGYSLPLAWTKVPTQPYITLIVRYRPLDADQEWLYSETVIVQMP